MKCQSSSAFCRTPISRLPLALLLIRLLILLSGPPGAARADEPASERKLMSAVRVYDKNPEHLWNRLHRALFVRRDHEQRIARSIQAAHSKEFFAGLEIQTVFGVDEVDPLLWPATEHLLVGDSHQRAIQLLDEFLESNGALLFRDPLRRAVLQNDLWAVFDWTDHPHIRSANMVSLRKPKLQRARIALRARLAPIIAQLALSESEIKNLPDNFANATSIAGSAQSTPNAVEPQLPAGLFRKDGDWLCLTGNVANEPAAINHVRFFSGRSTFLVFMKLPGGRSATQDYLQKLNLFPAPWIRNRNPVRKATVGPKAGSLRRNDVLRLNDQLPQFPVGTQLAFVRQMVVIDDLGQLQPTTITQSVQVRRYLRVGAMPSQEKSKSQAAFEWQLARKRLFADRDGGLHTENHEKPALLTLQFLTGWSDPFEEEKIARHLRPQGKTCASCHVGGGLESINTFSRAALKRTKQGPVLVQTSPADQKRRTADWKRSQHDWGLLQGLWERSNIPATRPSAPQP